MKVLILNGNPKTDNAGFDSYVDQLSDVMQKGGKEVKVTRLRDSKILSCTGCYNCWLRTPGLCVFQDDMAQILTDFLDADLVVFASPLLMGFYSSLLKRMIERMHPLALPYLTVPNDRMQHVMRYGKYPVVGFLLEQTDTYGAEYVEIVEQVCRSNTHWQVRFLKTTGASPEEVAHEADNL